MWLDDGSAHGLTRVADEPDAPHIHAVPTSPTGLQLDPVSRILTWRGKRRRLTPAQSSLMLLLMQAAPDPVSAPEIWASVHGYIPARPSSALRVLIHSLRLACKQTFGHPLIHTVRNHGYRLPDADICYAVANVSKN